MQQPANRGRGRPKHALPNLPPDDPFWNNLNTAILKAHTWRFTMPQAFHRCFGQIKSWRRFKLANPEFVKMLNRQSFIDKVNDLCVVVRVFRPEELVNGLHKLAYHEDPEEDEFKLVPAFALDFSFFFDFELGFFLSFWVLLTLGADSKRNVYMTRLFQPPPTMLDCQIQNIYPAIAFFVDTQRIPPESTGFIYCDGNPSIPDSEVVQAQQKLATVTTIELIQHPLGLRLHRQTEIENQVLICKRRIKRFCQLMPPPSLSLPIDRNLHLHYLQSLQTFLENKI